MDSEKSAPPAYQYEAMTVTAQPAPIMQGQPQLYPNPNAATTTTVYQAATVIQQPVSANGVRPPMQTYRDWNSKLCSCFDDMGSCCLVAFFPVPYMMYLYSTYDENCCAPLCLPLSVTLLRAKHRHRNGIHGTICDDVCTEWFCALCAICQLKRDIDFVKRSGYKL